MEEEKTVQSRKTYGKRGEKSQKLIAFRCDIELLDWLKAQANMGRYLNDLVRADKKRFSAD